MASAATGSNIHPRPGACSRMSSQTAIRDLICPRSRRTDSAPGNQRANATLSKRRDAKQTVKHTVNVRNGVHMSKPVSGPLMIAAVLLAVGCGGSGEKRMAVPADSSSYANVSAFVATNLVLDLTANFGARTLAGTAVLVFDRLDSKTTELVL